VLAGDYLRLRALFLAALRLPDCFLLEAFFAELFFPAVALLELFFAPPWRGEAFLDEAFFAEAFFGEALVALFGLALERVDVLAAAFFGAPPFLAAVLAPDLELLDPPDLFLVAPERPRLPVSAPPASSTVSALTSLLKLLFWPAAVSSW